MTDYDDGHDPIDDAVLENLEAALAENARLKTELAEAARMVAETAGMLAVVASEVDRLTAERDRAKAQLLAGPDKVLRCAFCGQPYPEGTPDAKHEALTAHVRVCPAHPLGREVKALQAQLADAGATIAQAGLTIEALRAERDKLIEWWPNMAGAVCVTSGYPGPWIIDSHPEIGYPTKEAAVRARAQLEAKS